MGWLKNATYPVRIDATVSYFSGWGDGYVQAYMDGYSQSNWDSIHDNTTGHANDTSNGADIGIGFDRAGSWMIHMNRAFFPFDTSDIPDSADISAAALKLYVGYNIYDQVNDSESYIAIVQTSQASTSALANGDFDQAGAINNPTLGSSEFDIGSLT